MLNSVEMRNVYHLVKVYLSLHLSTPSHLAAKIFILIMFSYTWHLLHFCPSWERDPSHVALSEVSTFFLPVKGFFSSFSLLLLRVKGRGCHTLLKPYETNCDLWIWAIQIKFDLIWFDMIIDFPNKTILNLLAHQHHITISVSILKKEHTDLEEVAFLAEEELSGSSLSSNNEIGQGLWIQKAELDYKTLLL